MTNIHNMEVGNADSMIVADGKDGNLYVSHHNDGSFVASTGENLPTHILKEDMVQVANWVLSFSNEKS